MALTVVAAACVVMLASCTTTVAPPTMVSDPVSVWIADYGRHASLILPREGERAGAAVEYAYGEWEWFALGNDPAIRAPAAMLWPTRGTLGRRDLARPESAGALIAQLGLEDALEVRVERANAQAVLARLDARFERGQDQLVHSPAYGLDFVPDPDDYSLAYHCNSAVAAWLREMGCRVSPAALVASFRVRRR